MSDNVQSAFERLNSVNVNGHTEKKNGLTYLSWAWAWAEVKKAYPDASYTIYESEGPMGPRFYFTDGKTCWVKTGVTVGGMEHIEMLPVMDNRNRSILLDSVTSTDVNKAIQRSLTKACARHGLGLYIYAGEDLPEDEAASPAEPAEPNYICAYCGKPIKGAVKQDGTKVSARQIAEGSKAKYGVALCARCVNDPAAQRAAS